mmetsp:Transcript_89534/g.280211  ORF Transcript_89534/g.280211 Transcript_89534/m.280211 type:complete len:222 (+) Transcript_89534:622-1287(+)
MALRCKLGPGFPPSPGASQSQYLAATSGEKRASASRDSLKKLCIMASPTTSTPTARRRSQLRSAAVWASGQTDVGELLHAELPPRGLGERRRARPAGGSPPRRGARRRAASACLPVCPSRPRAPSCGPSSHRRPPPSPSSCGWKRTSTAWRLARTAPWPGGPLAKRSPMGAPPLKWLASHPPAPAAPRPQRPTGCRRRLRLHNSSRGVAPWCRNLFFCQGG